MKTSDPKSPFEIKFTSREVSAWGGLALLKQMLSSMDFKQAAVNGIYLNQDPIVDINPYN
jgi:hypothetical protein